MRLRRLVRHLPVDPTPEFVGPIWEDRLTGARIARTAGAVLSVAIVVALAVPTVFRSAPGRATGMRPPQSVSAPILRAETASQAQTAPPLQLRPVPDDVRAIYLTSWSAATPRRVREAMTLARTTEVNGVVIDIKDYTGTVVFETSNPLIDSLRADVPRVDLAALVDEFHREGIYVIVRIAGFQDQHLLTVRPDLAVRDAQGRIWRDRKGLGWVDPASQDVWAYLVEIGREAVRAGADELNFDYIRFPSDGNLADLRYPVYDASRETKRHAIRRFFEYLTAQLRPTGAVLSADLFGLATVRPDDLGIGQVIEDAFLYFDYISPMVYPSHYARGFMQFSNPAAHPYEVVQYSLLRAEQRRMQFAQMLASIPEGAGAVTPIEHVAKIRPWLQAFDLGAPYPPPVIRRQMDAVYDTGLMSGWYLWNPSNRYQAATFEQEPPPRTSLR